MQAKVEVLLKNGHRYVFSCKDYGSFELLVKEASKFWVRRFYIGRNVVIKRSEIVAMTYFDKEQENDNG